MHPTVLTVTRKTTNSKYFAKGDTGGYPSYYIGKMCVYQKIKGCAILISVEKNRNTGIIL